MGLEHKSALVSNCEGQGVETHGSKGVSLVIFTRNLSYMENMAGGNQKKKEAIIRKEIEQVVDHLTRFKMK